MIECPKSAYDRLANSGIMRKIRGKRKIVESILLGADISGAEVYGIFDNASREYENLVKGRISEEEELYKNILELKAEAEKDILGINLKESLLIQHPSLLAFAVLGKKVLEFQKFGFPSRRSLEESVASFCLGEKHEIHQYQDDYVWRNGIFKNIISNSNHGDLYFGQIDVSGRDEKIQTLFGIEESFDTFKDDASRRNANAHHDCWGYFLGSILKYAQVMEKTNIPEIKNWRNALKEVGSNLTFTAEAEFGESDMFHDMLLTNLESQSMMNEGKIIETFPLHIPGQRNHYPYISKDGKLLYLIETEDGEIIMPVNEDSRLAKIKLSKYIEYDENDLPNLLRGTYKMFARDRRLLPKIM